MEGKLLSLDWNFLPPNSGLGLLPNVSPVSWVYRTTVAWEGRQVVAIKRDISGV